MPVLVVLACMITCNAWTTCGMRLYDCTAWLTKGMYKNVFLHKVFINLMMKLVWQQDLNTRTNIVTTLFPLLYVVHRICFYLFM